MKKSIAFMVGILFGATLVAQDMRINTVESATAFIPLISKVLFDAGIVAKVDIVPMIRGFSNLKSRNIHGIFFVSQEGAAQIADAIIIPVPLLYTEYVALAAKPQVKVTRISDLAAFRVGIERGNITHRQIAEEAGSFHEAADTRTLIRMLKADRFDLMIVTRDEIPSLMNAEGRENLFIQNPPLLRKPLYFVLSSEKKHLQGVITAAFQKTVSDGSWQTALSKLRRPLP